MFPRLRILKCHARACVPVCSDFVFSSTTNFRTVFGNPSPCGSMNWRPDRTFSFLAIDLLIASFCLTNIPTIVERAGIPFTAVLDNGRMVVADIPHERQAHHLAVGDEVVSWNGRSVERPEHLELLADLSMIGETIQIGLNRGGMQTEIPVVLVPFSSTLRFPLIFTLTGLVIFAFALFLVVRRIHNPGALTLHWTLIAAGALLLLTQGAIEASDPWSTARRAGLFLVYNVVAAGFLLFTTQFPVHRLGRSRSAFALIFAPSAIFTVALSYYHVRSVASGDAAVFHSFQNWYDAFHLYFFLCIAASLLILAVGYLEERSAEQRVALRWILWGLIIGSLPFTLLVVLPQAFGSNMLVPEELTTVFVLAVPLCFSVAFLRYHVFRVEVEVHRRLANVLIGILALSVQLLTVLVFLSILRGEGVFAETLPLIVTTIGLVLALEPFRTDLQRLLDEALYPTRTSMAKILNRASAQFHAAAAEAELGLALVKELHATLPGTTFTWYRVHRNALEAASNAGGTALPSIRIDDDLTSALRSGRLLAAERTTAASRSVDRSRAAWLRSHGFDLACGLNTDAGQSLGAVAGLLKEGRDPLTPEEVDAVLSVVARAVEAFERLYLQDRVSLEQQERKKSDELSRLKSHFVSSVSHDLRTPLTSIKMFAEMMRERRLTPAKRAEYAEIIGRESDRLARMVNNVLDFAKIERGTREYQLTPIDLNTVVRAAVQTMSGQARMLNGVLTCRLPRRPLRVRADADALQDALVNLIVNGFKYSGKRRRVRIEAATLQDQVIVRVIDGGIGIPAAELPKIFEPFYRVKDPRSAQAGGAGLGLPLVKHTVDAHGGTVAVESTVGKGTTVTILLPALAGKQ